MRLHPDTIAYVRSQAWPGNVRELENVIYRAFLLSDGMELRLGPSGPAVGARGVPPPAAEIGILADQNFRTAKARAVADFERTYIAELLARANGNVSLAARLAGKERSRFGKLLRKHGISGASFRA
jgi:DNA-binding NtrC family response regulator